MKNEAGFMKHSSRIIFYCLTLALAVGTGWSAAAQTKLFLTPHAEDSQKTQPAAPVPDNGQTLRSYALPPKASSARTPAPVKNYYALKKASPIKRDTRALSMLQEENAEIYRAALKIDPDLYRFSGREPSTQEEVMMLALANDVENVTSLMEYQRKKEDRAARRNDQQRRNESKARLVRTTLR
ncbi:MAG: hypothetical protein K9G62_00330 [Alphaproteobacteria bacterium]|nr:hypothetical protein [Alphaproteobacteria bacterium]